jgi:hypothetical protein
MSSQNTPIVYSLSRFPKFEDWLNRVTYVGNGTYQGTMEEALLNFFYNGISPWIYTVGYKWNKSDESYIAQKFLRFAYELSCALKQNKSTTLLTPEPMHRNFQEDRETFDMYADISSFVELLNKWEFLNEIIGTRLDHMIREFCYVWINVTYGKPGKWTQSTLDMYNEEMTDEDLISQLPDSNLNRRKYDLY